MARSSSPAKGGRRVSSPYPHISHDSLTGIFTITVRGQRRTATSDAVALWVRDQLLAEHGDTRECVTCGTTFSTARPNQLFCGLECRKLITTLRGTANLRKSRRVGPTIERYLYFDTSSYVARPYDMRLRMVLKRRFRDVEDARAFIRDVMNSTRPWRVRSCTSCGRTFDAYEEDLHLRSRKCADCGGEPSVAWGGGDRRTPLVTACGWCGDEIIHHSKVRPSRFCDGCIAAAQDIEELRARRWKFLSKT